MDPTKIAATVSALVLGGVVYIRHFQKETRKYRISPDKFPGYTKNLGGFVEVLGPGIHVSLPNLSVDHVWYYFEKVDFSFRKPVYLESGDGSLLIPKSEDIVYFECEHRLVSTSDSSVIHRGTVYA